MKNKEHINTSFQTDNKLEHLFDLSTPLYKVPNIEGIFGPYENTEQNKINERGELVEIKRLTRNQRK